MMIDIDWELMIAYQKEAAAGLAVVECIDGEWRRSWSRVDRAVTV